MFNTIFGHTSQLLQDAMKQDSNYSTVIAGNNPLELISLIERTIVAQAKDECPFKTVYDLERRFYDNQQHDRTGAQCYDACITEREVDAAAGIRRVHPSLIEYVKEHDASCSGTVFNALAREAQVALLAETVTNRLHACGFLMGASRNHAKLITDTNNDYAQGTHRFAADLPK